MNDVIISEGETWWQDSVNDRVWVKIKGGHWEATLEEEDDFEATTNETMLLRIRVPD
ncbi:MAG: hypothetical protein ABJP45_12425 [Cyclobacteriaceae bacterium]